MTTTSPAPPAGPPKNRRGRETAADMVRSLGLVMLVVVPLWFLAQPGDGAEQRVRVVDQSADLSAWTAAVPGALVPGQLPGWRPTVSDYEQAPVGLRLGWNTASGEYAEFAATTAAGPAFLEDVTGANQPDGAVEVDGTVWQRWSEADGSVSLAREVDGVTVVVGTRRATATEEELRALAATVTAGVG